MDKIKRFLWGTYLFPESEKEYDRKEAMKTLKAIIAVGYGMEKKG